MPDADATAEPALKPLTDTQAATLETKVYSALNAWRVLMQPGTVVSVSAVPEAGPTIHFLASPTTVQALRLDVCRMYSEAATPLAEDGRTPLRPPPSLLAFLDAQDSP